jgi:hypothetical protein
LEADPAVRPHGHRHAKIVELLFKNPLQPPWAGCKEP